MDKIKGYKYYKLIKDFQELGLQKNMIFIRKPISEYKYCECIKYIHKKDSIFTSITDDFNFCFPPSVVENNPNIFLEI